MFHLTFKSASNAKTTWAALALVLVSLFLLLPSLGPRSFVTDSLHMPSLHKTSQGSSTIPNIVHFVHLSYPNSTAPFEFPFRPIRRGLLRMVLPKARDHLHLDQR